MPIFDYHCTPCLITEEHFVSNSDVIVCCDKCSYSMDKQFPDKVSFDLKGIGFHKPGFSSYTIKPKKSSFENAVNIAYDKHSIKS